MVCCVVWVAPDTSAVCLAPIDHHGAIVRYILHQVARHLQRYILAFPQLVQRVHIVIKPLRRGRVYDADPGQIRVEIQPLERCHYIFFMPEYGELYCRTFV